MRSFAQVVRYRELLWVLVYRHIRAQTKASFLGYAWIIAQPLLATGFFSFLIQMGVLGIEPEVGLPYPLFLLSGIVVWNYFSGSLSNATEALVEHADLLRQVNFPREILVLYPLVGRLVDFVISFCVLVLFCLWIGAGLQIGLLTAPLIILPAVLFGYGLALILAPLNVVARDIGKAVPWLLAFAIYGTPVLYPLDRVPADWRNLMLLNPLAGVVENFRGLALYGQISNPLALGIACLVSLCVWITGQWFFDHFEKALSDVV